MGTVMWLRSYLSQGLAWHSLIKVVHLNDINKKLMAAGTTVCCVLVTALSTRGCISFFNPNWDSSKAGPIFPSHRRENRSKASCRDHNARAAGGRAGIQRRWVWPEARVLRNTADVSHSTSTRRRNWGSICQKDQDFPKKVTFSHSGTQSTNQAYALTGNQPGDPSLCGTTPRQLRRTRQGLSNFLKHL